jgi:hypothetical protein
MAHGTFHSDIITHYTSIHRARHKAKVTYGTGKTSAIMYINNSIMCVCVCVCLSK